MSAGEQKATTDVVVSGDEQQLVVFELGAELYGVEISRVHEIIRFQAVTRVPRAPAFVEGVINLRGKVIPIPPPSSHRAPWSRASILST
jgi:chemotaxis signal transduction protein